MEEPVPITLNSSPADLSNAAQSARNPATFAAIAGCISVQDARSGDLGIRPPTALSLRKKHERHGKEAKSGLRQQRTGE